VNLSTKEKKELKKALRKELKKKLDRHYKTCYECGQWLRCVEAETIWNATQEGK
jgi:hypothetical protein